MGQLRWVAAVVGADSIEGENGDMENPLLGVVREQLSPDLLISAFSFAQEAQQMESRVKPVDNLFLKHRSVVVAAILFSTAFLEAAVNELFQIACDQKLGTSRLSDAQKRILAPIWTVESFRRARILEKYDVALHLLGNEHFSHGQDPYQSTELVIYLRNAIAHYVPETSEVRLVTESDLSSAIEKRLRGRFASNPLVGSYPVIVRDQPDKRGSYPFFPMRCLGYGCAKWAVKAILSFAEDFFRRIDVKWHYSEYLDMLPPLK